MQRMGVRQALSYLATVPVIALLVFGGKEPRRTRPHSGCGLQAGIIHFRWLPQMSLTLCAFDDWRRLVWQRICNK